jgi:hypothetical protein
MIDEASSSTHLIFGRNSQNPEGVLFSLHNDQPIHVIFEC